MIELIERLQDTAEDIVAKVQDCSDDLETTKSILDDAQQLKT